MKAIIYNRHSQDSGTGVSEDIQDPAMLALVEARGGTIVAALPSDDWSSWTLDRPSFNEARRMLNAGEADTLVVPKLNRITRRRWHWEELVNEMDDNGWTVVPLDYTNLDLSENMGRMFAGMMIDQAEAEYRDKRKGMNESRENMVNTHGVHGGATPPLGYDWTTRDYAKNGKPLRGPLALTDFAPTVLAAFEAFDTGASWRVLVNLLGVKSQGNARSVLTNRAYIGEARSGAFVKPNAHPAIVSDALFARVNRKLVERAPAAKRAVGRTGSAPLAGCLKCGTCGRALRHEVGKALYRCKSLTCTARVSIGAEAVESFVIPAALDLHALSHADVAMALAVDDAMLPVLEAAVIEAQAEVLAIESDEALSPLRKAQAATAADAALADARRALDNAEASQGWHGLAPERVADKLTDPQAVNAFVREILTATVAPAGRTGKRLEVEARVTVTALVAGKTASERDGSTWPPVFALAAPSDAALEAYRATV